MKTLKALINKKNISNITPLKIFKNDLLRSGNIVTIQDNDENTEYDCIVILSEDSKCKFISNSYANNVGYLMTYRITNKLPSWWRISSFLKRFPIHERYGNVLITNIRKSDIDVTKIVEEKDLLSIFDKYNLIYDHSK